MLRVFQSKNADQAKSYFSKELTQGDYYSQGQEIVGIWGGKAAEKLGLSGSVDQESFNYLVDNINPETGERLTAHNKQDRTSYYDLTFNSPKALSTLYEFSQDERLLDAFRNAVHSTMDSIEDGMYARVRKDGLNENRKTGNLVYAEFVHFTARPVDGLAPDPHLHAHCVTMNLTHDDVENMWKAGQFRPIKTDAPFYEALFHSHLAKSLSDMGLDIKREGKFWTIEGLEKETLDKFSNRTEQIEEAAIERGITTAKGKDSLAQKTRGSKVGGLSRDDLRQNWWERLDDHEKSTFDKLSEFEAADDTDPPNFSSEEIVDFAIKHKLERQSVCSLNRIKETALRKSFGEASPAEIDTAFQSNEDLIIVGDQATTTEILAQEKQIINFTRQGYASQEKLNSEYEIGLVTNHKKGQTFELGEEQQNVITKLLDSRHRIQAIEGKAGTGKTTTLATLIDGIEQGGGNATCLAPTADASYKTLKNDGEAYQSQSMQNAHTLARYFVDEKLWQESKGNTLLVDEAGLMSVDDMHTLFSLANQFDNRIILIGDTSQHNSVLRGDAFRILQQEAGLKPLGLEAIRRQEGEYRQAVKTISEGNLVTGYDMLDKMNSIIEINDATVRYSTLAERYADVIEQKGKSALTVAPTHAEGKLVTDAIRDTLKDRGHIKNEEHKVTRFKNLQLTEAEKGDSFYFQKGNMIRFQQNGKGEFGRINRGEQFTISKTDKYSVWMMDSQGIEQQLNLSQVKKYNIYEPQDINLSIGDAIRITEGHKSKDLKRLNNGAIYHVKEVNQYGDITLNNNYTLDSNKGNFDYGYVTTSYSSQGKTVDNVFIAQGSDYSGASSAEQFYVSVSRGSESVEIFTDNKAELREQIQHSNQRTSATQLVESRLKDKEIIVSEDSMVASLEFYARQFMNHLKDSANDWLNAFRRTDQSVQPDSTKWRELVTQRQLDQKEQHRDLSL